MKETITARFRGQHASDALSRCFLDMRRRAVGARWRRWDGRTGALAGGRRGYILDGAFAALSLRNVVFHEQVPPAKQARRYADFQAQAIGMVDLRGGHGQHVADDRAVVPGLRFVAEPQELDGMQQVVREGRDGVEHAVGPERQVRRVVQVQVSEHLTEVPLAGTLGPVPRGDRAGAAFGVRLIRHVCVALEHLAVLLPAARREQPLDARFAFRVLDPRVALGRALALGGFFSGILGERGGDGIEFSRPAVVADGPVSEASRFLQKLPVSRLG